MRVLQVSATAFDMRQLTESMSSITIDPSFLNDSEFVAAHSQKKPTTAFHVPAQDQPRYPLPGSYIQPDLGGLDATGDMTFHCDDSVISQIPMHQASALQNRNFSQPTELFIAPCSQPISCQPPISHLQTTVELAPNVDDNIDQFGSFDLQDMMLISDELQ